MALIFDEGFEGTGFEESWGDETGGGNLNEDASVTLAGSPSGWGSQCLEIEVIDGDVYIYTNSLGVVADVFWRVEVVITSESITNNNYLALFGIYNSSLSAPAFGLALEKDGVGNLRFNGACFEDGNQNNYYSNVVVLLNTHYRFEIKWDSTNNVWAWRINGVDQPNNVDADYPITSEGTLSDTHITDAGSIVVGTIDTFDAGTFYADNVTCSDSDWVGGVPLSANPTYGNGFVQTSPVRRYSEDEANLPQGWLAAQKFTCPDSGTQEISEIGAYVFSDSGTSDFRMAIFTDDSGNAVPEAMVSNSETATLVAPNVPLPDTKIFHTYETKPQLTGGTDYWLIVFSDDDDLYADVFNTSGIDAVVITGGETAWTWPTGGDWHGAVDASDTDASWYAVYAAEAEGGDTYNESPSDNITLAETLSESLTGSSAITDNITLAETLSNIVTAGVSSTDNIEFAETTSESLTGSLTSTDTLNLSDTVNTLINRFYQWYPNTFNEWVIDNTKEWYPLEVINVIVYDTIAFTETTSESLTGSSTLTDDIEFAEITSEILTATTTILDNITFTETLSELLTASPSPTDNIEFAETTSESLTGASTITDNVEFAETTSESLTATPTLTDDITFAETTSDSLTGASTITDNVEFAETTSESLTAAPALTDDITFAETINELLTAIPVVLDNITFTETTSESLTGASTITELTM